MATAITAPIMDAGPPNGASSDITVTSQGIDTVLDHPDGAEIRRQVRLPFPSLLVSAAVELIVLQGGVLLFR
jgi:hypothetical protein